MEPESTSDYSKQDYWDKRYEVEPEFDWFETAYKSCLELCMKALLRAVASTNSNGGAPAAALSDGTPVAEASSSPDDVVVLHLGCGNSRLCKDMHVAWGALPEGLRCGRRLRQIAVDYSPVVIEKMKQKYDDLSVGVEWLVDDVRALQHIPSRSVDVVIDKGTMDALQADKENEALDDHIDSMLQHVSRVLRCDRGVSLFVQLTWEIPYYRFHFTKRPCYAWGASEPESCFVGDSDLYRCYVYPVVTSVATVSEPS